MYHYVDNYWSVVLSSTDTRCFLPHDFVSIPSSAALIQNFQSSHFVCKSWYTPFQLTEIIGSQLHWCCLHGNWSPDPLSAAVKEGRREGGEKREEGRTKHSNNRTHRTHIANILVGKCRKMLLNITHITQVQVNSIMLHVQEDPFPFCRIECDQ